MDNSEKRNILRGRRRSGNNIKAHPNLKKSTAQCRLHGSGSKHDSQTKLANESQINLGHEFFRSHTKSNNCLSTLPPSFSDNESISRVEHNSSLTSNVNNSDKFSANDRLRKYRVCLSGRRNELVRVHQVLNKPCNDEENNINVNHSKSGKMETSLLGKRHLPRETDKSKQSIDHEDQCKKRKTTKEIEIVKSTTDSSTTETSISNDSFKMDWSPINETEIVSNIQKFRETQRDKLFGLGPEATSFISLSATSCENSKNDVLYIVVDTNIFISHIHLIQNILSGKHVEHDVIVYVPWIVVQELDYFKDGRSGSSVMLKTARRAIKFINENLLKKHRRLKGQTVQEVLSQKESVSNADDNILFCCMNLAQSSNNVVLLSNDVNLRNKALINNIKSYGPKNILEEIKIMKICEQNSLKQSQINSVFVCTCTEIILSEMEEAYGSVLFNLITKPPWDLKQCLIYFKRFWIPVFSLVISQKQCLKVVEDLLAFVETHDDLATEENMEQFIKLCLSLCVYFKNCLPKYHKVVKSCIEDIQKILS